MRDYLDQQIKSFRSSRVRYAEQSKTLETRLQKVITKKNKVIQKSLRRQEKAAKNEGKFVLFI